MTPLPRDLAAFKQEIINFTSDRNALPTCLDLANRMNLSFRRTNQLAISLVNSGHAKFNRDPELMEAKLIPQFHDLDKQEGAA